MLEIKDEKAQVSLEYLMTIMFAILLAIAASILALNLASISQAAKAKILAYRESTIASLMG